MFKIGIIPALLEVTGYQADGQWEKSTQIKIKLQIVSSDCEENPQMPQQHIIRELSRFECELSRRFMCLNIWSQLVALFWDTTET